MTPPLNSFEKIILNLLSLILLLILATGWYINNLHFSEEVESAKSQSKNEVALFSSIINKVLETYDYQLIENILIDLAKNKPEILEISLTSDNNLEMVRIDRPALSNKAITNKATLLLPDTSPAELTITTNIEKLYSDNIDVIQRLILVYLFITFILCLSTYFIIKIHRQKHILEKEVALRKKTETFYIQEKEKSAQSTQIQEQLRHEKEQINIELQNEINKKQKIEMDLEKLNITLENKVNDRTIKLENLNKKIGSIAREAGMAEVATGILHNVGNVLNSINISASVIREQIKLSKANNISRIVKMLDENKNNLGNFIEHDEKGKQIPDFLNLLSTQLEDEKCKILSELDIFGNNIDHIKSIIKMQQSYAGEFGVKEKTSIADLIEDALKININNMDYITIDYHKEKTNIPEAYLDKHKVLQILINLISNAKYALLESNTQAKEIRISAYKDNKNIIIQVQDNGIGIEKEYIDRIFEYGFKRRQNGHGFGLHNCTLIANEINGKIEAHSAGSGKGSCFTLTILDTF